VRTIAAALVVVLGMCATARADEPDPADPVDAREVAEQAQRHFDLGEYDAAIAGYREAYRMDPRPALLYNLGQAYRLLGDCVTAALMYRNFVRLAPESKYRAVADEHVAELAKCEQERLAAGAKPATEEGSEPPPDAGEVPPPLEVPEPIRSPVEVTPDPTPLPVVRTQPRAAHRLRVPGYIATAAGAVLAGVGGYLSMRAWQASRDVSDAYRDGAAWSDIEALDERGRSQEVSGGVLLGVGSAVAVAGLVVAWKF
jgi:tetratricopeptide (TPR) repeat protein